MSQQLDLIPSWISDKFLPDISTLLTGMLGQFPATLPNTTLPFYATILRQFIGALRDATTDASLMLADKKCYPMVGCFEKTLSSYLIGVPSNEYKTRFLLSTSSDPDATEELVHTDNKTVQNCTLLPNCTTFFLIYGFQEAATSPWIGDMRTTIFNKNPCANVIIVDWNSEKNPNYVRLVIRAELSGRRTAVIMALLAELKGANSTQFHVIGFSLGAQIAGYAGKYLKERFGNTIGRISALDPAAPGFCTLPETSAGYHLQKEFADVVDVIHTNSGRLVRNQMSCMDPLGHVDFYPNGGQAQPYCTPEILKVMPHCSHTMAHIYYMYSISSTTQDCRFKSFPAKNKATFSDFTEGKYFTCTSGKHGCSEMGYNSINYTGTGKQYLVPWKDIPYIGSQFLFELTSEGPERKVPIQLINGNVASSIMNLTLGVDGSDHLVAASKCVDLDFTAGSITAFIKSHAGLKRLAVTDQEDNGPLYYCNGTNVRRNRNGNSTLQLTSSKC